MDIIQNIIGEYTLLTLVLIVVSTFLKRFVPPIKEQWRMIITTAVGCGIAYLMPPNDYQAYLYALVIAGLVIYKEILVDEIRLVLTLAKKHKEHEENSESSKS